VELACEHFNKQVEELHVDDDDILRQAAITSEQFSALFAAFT
jgi:hypothetical protein